MHRSAEPSLTAGTYEPCWAYIVTCTQLQTHMYTHTGVDAAGNSYFWFDWCEEGLEGGADLGFMLAREGPACVPK